ncbi:MAG: DUF1844 domain-containing protein [Candidatus Bathyarchaeota archaeon]
MSSEREDVQSYDLKYLEVDQLLRFFIGALAGKALDYLGAPVKEDAEPVKDLRRAKVAIDSVSVLVDQLAALASEDEVNQLRGLLSDLQLSFVMAG